MAQHGQQLPAWRQCLGHGDPGLFEFAAQPFMLGLLGSLLAEAFGVVVEGAVPAGRGEQLVDGAGVVFELGQDGELVQGQLVARAWMLARVSVDSVAAVRAAVTSAA